MYPARTSSRWLGTSASAGSSRRVRRNRVDIRNSTVPIVGLRPTTAIRCPPAAALSEPREGRSRPSAVGSVAASGTAGGGVTGGIVRPLAATDPTGGVVTGWIVRAVAAAGTAGRVVGRGCGRGGRRRPRGAVAPEAVVRARALDGELRAAVGADGAHLDRLRAVPELHLARIVGVIRRPALDRHAGQPRPAPAAVGEHGPPGGGLLRGRGGGRRGHRGGARGGAGRRGPGRRHGQGARRGRGAHQGHREEAEADGRGRGRGPHSPEEKSSSHAGDSPVIRVKAIPRPRQGSAWVGDKAPRRTLASAAWPSS